MTDSKRRGYGQYCGVACALDLVGDRWTLLIVRDLLLGPLRYTDLREGLPGIATNLLSERLRHLEEHGLVERTVLPRPSTGTAYGLTDEGQRLAPAVVALGRFGGKYLPERPDGEHFRPRLAVTGLAQTFRASRTAELRRTYRLVLDGEPYQVVVDHGRLSRRQGAPDDPQVTIEGAATELLEVLGGRIGVDEALADATLRVRVEHESSDVGDAPQELALFVQIFGWE